MPPGTTTGNNNNYTVSHTFLAFIYYTVMFFQGSYAHTTQQVAALQLQMERLQVAKSTKTQHHLYYYVCR